MLLRYAVHFAERGSEKTFLRILVAAICLHPLQWRFGSRIMVACGAVGRISLVANGFRGLVRLWLRARHGFSTQLPRLRATM